MSAHTKSMASEWVHTRCARRRRKRTGYKVAWLKQLGGLFVFLIIGACTAAPERHASAPTVPIEFTDYVPMESGVMHKIAQYYGYEVEKTAAATPLFVIFHVDSSSGLAEPLATVAIDGVVVNEYSRKSIFAVSWDEKTLLYMHEQLEIGPENLRNKPSGLYEYIVGEGERTIHPRARVLSHSTFPLTRNSIEFALGKPNEAMSKRYIRTTEGFEMVQEEALFLQYGGSELHLAAGEGDMVRVRRIIESGGDLESRDNRGFTPLHTAIWEGHEEMAKFLIEAGADVNSRIHGSLDWTPVAEAARFGLVGTIKLLIDKGAVVNEATRNGVTPLHLALDFKKYNAAVALINRGADVNATTSVGVTPLQLFAKDSRDERSAGWDGSQAEQLLRLLLAKGADVNARNMDGATALHYAVLKNNLRTAEILAENGADTTSMELPDRQYYGRELHHDGSELTLRQRISETLQSSWWREGMPNATTGSVQSSVTE